MKITPNSRLVFIGDSITDTGRAQPYGEHGDALGNGYVSLIAAHLGTVYPEIPIRVTNVGTSGNTVRDLKARWQRDVLDLKPDYLSIMIGINDVWRQFDRPTITDAVSIQEYEETLEELVCKTLPTLSGLIIMAPFYIEPDPNEPMRACMDKYGAVAKRIAEKYGALFVDTQAAFDAILAHCHSSSLAWDRVHPHRTGHYTIARAFLKTIGAEW